MVKIEGIPLSQMNDNELSEYRATRMGFVFQSFNLLPVLTALENVELPLLVAGINEKDARLRALSMLSRVDLEEWAHHRPMELSGGQQQRVAIARALISRPAIIWADEPTGNLDSAGADQITALLKTLNKANRQTFVIVTHDPSVAKTADRLISMKRRSYTLRISYAQCLIGQVRRLRDVNVLSDVLSTSRLRRDCNLAFCRAAVTNKSIFTMGVRNIVRRPKSAAIIVGALLVSTAIISGSLVASSSLSYSVVKATYDSLGNIDENHCREWPTI